MTDPLAQRIIGIIQDTLADTNGAGMIPLSVEDSMETVPAWDSMSFMSVFLAINEAFGLDPDFDDAIHYTSVNALRAYLGAETS